MSLRFTHKRIILLQFAETADVLSTWYDVGGIAAAVVAGAASVKHLLVLYRGGGDGKHHH